MVDLRKDKRAPASLKVKYKSATVDEFVEQFGSDVSRGGIFIKTKKPIETGALLKLELQLNDASPVIHGIGRVCFRRETSTDPNLPAGMGIKFIKLDPESRTIVERIVHARGERPSRFDQTEGAEIAPPSIPPEGDPEAERSRTTPVPSARAPAARTSPIPTPSAKPVASTPAGASPTNSRAPAPTPIPAPIAAPPAPRPAPVRAPLPPPRAASGNVNRPLPLGASSANAAQVATASTRPNVPEPPRMGGSSGAAALPAKEAPKPLSKPASPPARRSLGAGPGGAAVAGLFADSPIAHSGSLEPSPSSGRSSFFPPADDGAKSPAAAKLPSAPRPRNNDIASVRATAKGPASAARAEQARHSGEFLATAFAEGGVTKSTADQARANADAQRAGEDALIDQLFADVVEPVPSAPPAESAKSAQDSMDDMFAQLGREEGLSGARRPSSPSTAGALPAARSSQPVRASEAENVDDLFADLNAPSRPPARPAAAAPAPPAPAPRFPPPAAAEEEELPELPPVSEALGAEWDGDEQRSESNEADIGMSEVPQPFSQPPRLSASPAPESAITSRAGSPALWIGLAVLVLGLAGGGYFMYARAKTAALDQVRAVPLDPQPAPSAAPSTAAAPTAQAPAAASPAAAPGATIEVEVGSVPRGADVLLNGKRVGITPMRLPLRTGEATQITVSSSGYASMTKSVTPAAEQEPLSFKLDPLPYVVTVQTIPPGAELTVGDKSAIAPGPLDLGHLDGGVLVSVGKTGFQRMTRPLRLDEFSERDGVMRAEIEVRLSALPGAAQEAVRARIRRRPDEPPPPPPEPGAEAAPAAAAPEAPAAAAPEAPAAAPAAPAPAPGTPPPAPDLPPEVTPTP
jgi:uncharacterized protein (TIGR02266 family)